jgi:hypothetical protein
MFWTRKELVLGRPVSVANLIFYYENNRNCSATWLFTIVRQNSLTAWKFTIAPLDGRACLNDECAVRPGAVSIRPAGQSGGHAGPQHPVQDEPDAGRSGQPSHIQGRRRRQDWYFTKSKHIPREQGNR